MNDPDRPLLRFAITFSNAGYMGFPLIEALFGAEGLLYASIFNTFSTSCSGRQASLCWPPAAGAGGQIIIVSATGKIK